MGNTCQFGSRRADIYAPPSPPRRGGLRRGSHRSRSRPMATEDAHAVFSPMKKRKKSQAHRWPSTRVAEWLDDLGLGT